ncbi:DUF2812 domain-containing protein [Romboutsia hominis]|uniref:DUF2812 domain-containing protein n=1 Tax=Romboutsia hominis TaxID=1507512 RepID=UPI000B89FC96|nr:DUF2812 domain-containing protein [Romboutsia hominis]
MKKIVFKYFFDFLEGQEKWLNKMAKHGYRLVKVGKLTYEFEKCNPSEYIYCVEFVADKSNSEIKKYKNFLEDDIGYKSFRKNININWSFGKMKFRSWSNGGKIATSPGSFNKELLILEKQNDGMDFNLHTSNDDLIKYLTPIRNMYLFTTILLSIITFVSKYKASNHLLLNTLLWGLILITLFLGIQTIKYFNLVKKYKKDKKLYE